MLLRPTKRWRISAALVVIVLVCAAGNLAAYPWRPRGRIKVAAVGWTSANKGKYSEALQDQIDKLRKTLDTAKKAAGGVKLPGLPT